MKYLFITVSICLFFIACGMDPKPALSGCCSNPAIDVSFGNGSIYIPNIFTPNGDGFNDYFMVLGDSIQLIHSLEIRNRDDMMVFEKHDFLPNLYASSWDGTTEGVVQKGIYTFDLNVEAEDGTIKQIQGKVCNYPCGDLMLDELISGQGCQFPSQVDPHGYFCPTCPTNESFDCFE